MIFARAVICDEVNGLETVTNPLQDVTAGLLDSAGQQLPLQAVHVKCKLIDLLSQVGKETHRFRDGVVGEGVFFAGVTALLLPPKRSSFSRSTPTRALCPSRPSTSSHWGSVRQSAGSKPLSMGNMW